QSNAGWHYITPTGEIYQHVPSFVPGNLAGTLDANYYANPQKLVNVPASPPDPGASTATVTGNQIVVDPEDAIRGDLRLEITATDGRNSVTRVATIRVVGGVPMLLAGEAGD